MVVPLDGDVAGGGNLVIFLSVFFVYILFKTRHQQIVQNKAKFHEERNCQSSDGCSNGGHSHGGPHKGSGNYERKKFGATNTSSLMDFIVLMEFGWLIVANAIPGVELPIPTPLIFMMLPFWLESTSLPSTHPFHRHHSTNNNSIGTSVPVAN